MGDLGSIPRLGRSPAEGNGYPLQYSGLEDSMDCIVHEVAKSPTQLSNFHFHFQVALVVKNSPANARDISDTGSIPTLERSPGGGHGSTLQYSCLKNPMDGGQAAVHRVTQSWTRLRRLSAAHTST